MKLFLRVLPIALALMLPSFALAEGAKAPSKGRGTHAAAASHAKAVKKPKVKAIKKPTKAAQAAKAKAKVKAVKKPSAPHAPKPKS